MSLFRRNKKSEDDTGDADSDGAGVEVHRFSNEAFALARAFAQNKEDGSPEDSKAQAREMLERLPDVVAVAHSCPADRQADLNRVLSDARLDLNYVLSDGTLPTSVRLARALEG